MVRQVTEAAMESRGGLERRQKGSPLLEEVALGGGDRGRDGRWGRLVVRKY